MIYLYTKVNEKVGLGNLSRCIVICEGLQRQGMKVKLFVHGSSKYKRSFYFPDIHFFETDKSLIEKLVLESYSVDSPNGIVLVTDLPVLALELLGDIHKINTQTVISLNDQYVNELNPDIYINSDEVMDTDKFIGEKYVGLKYQLIRGDLAEYRPKTIPIINEIKNVTFIFGGSDPGQLIEETLQQIKNQKLEFISQIVIGPGVKEERKSNLLNKATENVRFFINPDIPSLLLKSDLIVTMGGMTSYEAMYLGKPVLAVEWNYMSKYVRYLEEKRLLISLGEIESYLERLNTLIVDLERLGKIAEKGYLTIDGLGNERIVNIISSALKKH